GTGWRAPGQEPQDWGQALPQPRNSLDQVAPELPERITLSLRRRGDLRYGENPHQAGALYVWEPGPISPSTSPHRGLGQGGVAFSRQLQGKALSYNNLNDAEAA